MANRRRRGIDAAYQLAGKCQDKDSRPLFFRKPADDEALKVALQNREAAQKTGEHATKVAAGRQVGETGAQHYMNTRHSSTALKHTGHGKNDFDFVYLDEATKTYYVVEAKGLNGARRTRNVNPDLTAAPIHAQQGSADYLNGTIDAMINAGGVRAEIATKLRDARNGVGGFRLAYLEVATTKGPAGPYFRVTHWIE